MVEIAFEEHALADGSLLLEVSTYASSFAMRPGICGLYLLTKESLQFFIYPLPGDPVLTEKLHGENVQRILAGKSLVDVTSPLMPFNTPAINPDNWFLRHFRLHPKALSADGFLHIQRYLSWGAVEVIHRKRNKEARTQITDRRFGAAFCKWLFRRLCDFYGPQISVQTMPAKLGEAIRLPLIVLGIVCFYFGACFLITLGDPSTVKPQMIEVRGVRAIVLFINSLGPVIVGALFASVLLGLGVWTVRRVRKQPGKKVLQLADGGFMTEE